MELNYLQKNPIVKTMNYQYYFDVSNGEASKMHTLDKLTLGKKKLTFSDFFILYKAFPCPQFKPTWKTITIPFQNDLNMSKIEDFFQFFQIFQQPQKQKNEVHIALTNNKKQTKINKQKTLKK